MTHVPLMYGELAGWWPLLSAPADYAEEAAFYVSRLREHARVPARTLLELGSGGANNASHMKVAFDQVTLVDTSPDMLQVSRALNPECEHLIGDMRSIRLGRIFDCVFVHDAICYATTLEDLRRVIQSAYVHCRQGGAALLAPDYVIETFRVKTSHGGHDATKRSLRYLQWTWDPDPSDDTYTVDYALLLREADGSIEVRHDRHVEGLFAESVWLRVLEESGFAADALRFRHSESPGESVVFVGVKESP
jgi:SAM-dependent methyltransferase